MKPHLLDLFCGAGGATRGYQRAGFHVTGVDIKAQSNYCGDDFQQADAVQFLKECGHYFDAIHASPPCQTYSAMSNCRPGLAEKYPDLVNSVRQLLHESGSPWVMENVPGSSVASQPTLDGEGFGVTLCGHMFGLKLYRHRHFESNIPIVEPQHPRHLTPGSPAGHWIPGTIISVAGDGGPGAEEARKAMGIDWMTRSELSEAIPPAFTEYIGGQLMIAVRVR